MKVNHSFEFTDDQLRSIRAWESRGGRATRNEVRTWLDRLVEVAFQDMPPPKRRRKLTEDESSQAAKRAEQAYAADYVRDLPAARRALRERIEALPYDALCERCGYRKEEHGKMGFACPAPHRGTFVPHIPSQ